MPPKPIMPTSTASSTCGRRSAPSSVSGLLTCMVRNWSGSQNQSAVMVSTPMNTTSPNALRQPSAWPSQEAIGTPSTVAIVNPDSTWATALARFCGPIRWAAARAAIPKNAPCGRPATNRAITSVR